MEQRAVCIFSSIYVSPNLHAQTASFVGGALSAF
jgi:hypothetical protein